MKHDRLLNVSHLCHFFSEQPFVLAKSRIHMPESMPDKSHIMFVPLPLSPNIVERYAYSPAS
jgi:hypothetical protein